MNKAEKIKAEIERLKNELIQEVEKGYKSEFDEGRISAFEDMIVYINSLSDTEKDFGIKESVIPFGASDSELMEATYFIPQGYHAAIEGNKVIIKKGEEPVSNDLEEAAHSYVDTTIEWFDSEGNPCCYPAFIAGAQWQKQQDQSTIELAEDSKEEVLTWLEEQGKQKQKQYDIDVLEKHITKDSISELAHTVIVRNGWEIVDAKESQNYWSEEDENTIKVLMNIIRKSEIIDSIYTDSLKEKLYDWLKSLKQRIGG